MREQVPDGDAVLAVRAELGEVAHDRVVELERAALPLLRDRHRHARLGHREPDDHRVGGHRRAGAGFADAEVGDRLAVDGHVEHRAGVEAAFDAVDQRQRRRRERRVAPLPSIECPLTGRTLTVTMETRASHDGRRWTPPTDDDAPPSPTCSSRSPTSARSWRGNAPRSGLITAGLAITQLLPSFDFPGGRRLIGLPLIALGILIAVGELLGVAPQPGRDPARPAAAALAPPADRGHRRVGGRDPRVRAGDRRGLGLVSTPRSTARSSSGRRAHRPGVEPQRPRHRRLRARRDRAASPSTGSSAPTWPSARSILVLGFASYLLAGLARAPAARAGPRRAAGTTGRSPAAGDRRDRDRRRRVRARPAVPRVKGDR